MTAMRGVADVRRRQVLRALGGVAALAGWPGAWAASQAAGPGARALGTKDVEGAVGAVRIVHFYGDQQLRVPAQVRRVATAWEAQNAIIAMLGHGADIVATTRIVRDMPVFRRFVPSIAEAVLAGSGNGDLNVEELIRLRPDILFLSNALPPARLRQLENAGIAVAVLKSNSLDHLVERVRITGDLLGEAAQRKAHDYIDYFNGNVARVRAALARVPAERRLRVYHAVGEPLSTSGRPSLNQDWLDLGGALNVAEHWFSGGARTGKVSLEEIIAADPDVIVAMRAEDARHIREDSRWRGLRAVRTGRVHANPRGMFWWCRETSEQALQFLWLACLLYPEAMAEVDMRHETREFYARFYGYRLTDAEVDDFLSPPG